MTTAEVNVQKQQRAKRYEAIHNVLFVVETVYALVLLVVFLLSDASDFLADSVQAISPNPWISTTVYAVIVLYATKLLFLPLNWFSGFFLEHRFGLSNQELSAWLFDEAKSLVLNLLLGVIALDVVYFLLRRAGDWWWVGAGLFFLLFGVVLSIVYPVLILPLFYRLKPLENESLRDRLTGLAQQVGANVVGVYRMAMSEKTKKANAAFAGLGATKRIILGDTLLDQFAEDEIEVVMAHEMAHYKHGDISKLIAWSTMTTFIGLKITDILLRWALPKFGFTHISDLGAFPLLALCLFGFAVLVTPLNNAFSRWRERKADRAALELTRNPEGFVRAMRKLAAQNLADLSPHPWIEFLLHDHPSLARRIAWAEAWQAERVKNVKGAITVGPMNGRFFSAVLTSLTVLTFLTSCGSQPPPEIQWKAFDGQRAYEHVKQFVGCGPHPSGSPELSCAATYITGQLRGAGLDVEEQTFTASTPRGPMQFRNIIGRTRSTRGGDGKIIVIGSHYDTKWMTNIVFVGANDGGSSMGVLLELARVAANQPNLCFVFFDGEEAMVEFGPSDGLWGSKHFVEDLQRKGQAGRIRAMILLDMIGDAHLNITLPADSTAALVQQVFQAARETGNRDYFEYRGTSILDDHVPFLDAAIPAIDLIDFEYGSAPGLNDYWHTEKDTLDKISPHSLTVVGQTALRLVSMLQAGPAAR